MKWYKDPKWWAMAFERMIRTLAQGLIAGMGTSATMMEEVNWKVVISMGIFAAITSIFTSIAFGIPEYDGGGTDDN